jgi:hyaluronoglucosaminidase
MSNALVPVDIATDRAGKPIMLGGRPAAIVIAPDGKTAYAVSDGAGIVTPIDVTRHKAGAPIKVGPDPQAIVIAP